MGLYDKIKKLAKERKISIRKLEEDLGYGNGTIRRWDVSTPGVDKLQEVADYFKVSTDFLLGRIENLEQPTMAELVMMRMDTEGLSNKQLDEIESEMERFFSWRIDEIKREQKD